MGKPIIRLYDEDKEKYVAIPAIKGDKGDTYTLTAADKQEIAELVLAQLPDGDEVSYG